MKRTQMEYRKNKGFTLVELIVVLVILAILAAILVPALLGYIDKAKREQLIIQGRSVMNAAQTVATEGYATCTTTSSMYFMQPNEPGAGGVKYGNLIRIGDLAEMPDNSGFFFSTKDFAAWDGDSSTLKKHNCWIINQVVYWEGDYKSDPYCAYFDGQSWTTDMKLSEAVEVLRKNKVFWKLSILNGNKVTCRHQSTNTGGFISFVEHSE